VVAISQRAPVLGFDLTAGRLYTFAEDGRFLVFAADGGLVKAFPLRTPTTRNAPAPRVRETAPPGVHYRRESSETADQILVHPSGRQAFLLTNKSLRWIVPP
jgi:hypothetical protein